MLESDRRSLPDAAQEESVPKGIPVTDEEHTTRKREIFNAALHLFLEQGFHETSMRAIAEAAGMGKSSLYDYFRTKDEILLFVLEEETALLTARTEALAAAHAPPDVRLQQIMAMHLDFMLANRKLLLRLGAEAQRLKPASLQRIQAQRYAYQDRVARVIEEGIAQGCFRAVNPLNAARLLINTLLSVLYTTRPTGTPHAMLAEAIDIFLGGLKQERSPL